MGHQNGTVDLRAAVGRDGANEGTDGSTSASAANTVGAGVGTCLILAAAVAFFVVKQRRKRRRSIDVGKQLLDKQFSSDSTRGISVPVIQTGALCAPHSISNAL